MSAIKIGKQKLRWVVRISILCFSFYLIWLTKYPLNTEIPVHLFPRISPLNALISILSSRKFLLWMVPGLLFLSLSFLLGRYICRWICPLGTLFELCRNVLQRRKWKLRARKLPVLGYAFLGLVVGMAILSIPTWDVFEPSAILLHPFAAPGRIISLSFLLLLILLSVLFPNLWCGRVCPMGALQSLARGLKPETKMRFDASKRQFLAGVGAGLCAAFLLKKIDLRRYDPRLLRPPGALPEEEFTGRCVRCGECMKVCVNQCLLPCFLEAGFEGFWTPRLIPRKAPCVLCMLCGDVCPTRAIEALKEVRQVRIGTSEVNKDRCIAWTEGKLCLVCQEYCPTSAILSDTMNRPYVISDICVGCGQCEHNCPVDGEAAIIVKLPALEGASSRMAEAFQPRQEVV